MEFPAMLYRHGTMFEWDGEWFDYLIVKDQDEARAAVGWVAHKPRKRKHKP